MCEVFFFGRGVGVIYSGYDLWTCNIGLSYCIAYLAYRMLIMLAHNNEQAVEQTVEQSVEGHNTFPSPRKTSSIDIMWYCLQGSSMVTL